MKFLDSNTFENAKRRTADSPNTVVDGAKKAVSTIAGIGAGVAELAAAPFRKDDPLKDLSPEERRKVVDYVTRAREGNETPTTA